MIDLKDHRIRLLIAEIGQLKERLEESETYRFQEYELQMLRSVLSYSLKQKWFQSHLPEIREYVEEEILQALNNQPEV